MEQGSETSTTSTQITSSNQHTEKEVLISSLSVSSQSYKALNFTNQAGSLTCGVKDFSMGLKFTAFHLENNDLVFMTNQEYLKNGFNLDKISPNNIRKNVAKFSTAANDLFYLTTSGQLYVVFSKTNTEFVEGVLEITVQSPLTDIVVSYPHAIIQLKDTSFKCFDMANLTIEDLNSPARIRNIEGLENKSIVSFCAGVSFAYFLTAEGKIFECNFKIAEDYSYKVTPFEHFNNSTIRRLWCGKGTFFALEQNEKPSIDNWTQKEILEWVQQNKDFEDYIKIIKSENVTGKDLLTADTEFLVDRLGLQKEDLQTKFLNEIEKVSKKTYSTPKLYGWGNNNSGQLGLNSTQSNVGSPVEIKALPEMDKNDYIEHIECGTKATIILTHSGKVWITEIPNKDNKDKAAMRWIDLTQSCQSTKKGRQNRVIRVSLNKDHLAVLVNVEHKEMNRNGENNEQSGSNKLKGADHICSRLLWDKTLNKDEFVVGYEDRFLGILEIPFTKFTLKTDIPTHRIKFFKQNGEIVWDRAAKTNKIGL